MKEIKNGVFTGERALFMTRGAVISDSVFEDGESPLKHSENIETHRVSYRWKYPLWYGKDITVRDCVFEAGARAGIWYTNGISLENCVFDAPKGFRRCDGVTLKNIPFSNAAETLWSCKNAVLENVTVAQGDYFLMNSENVTVDGLMLNGNYGFDGCKNVFIKNSTLMTKDAFWNCENVTVENSTVIGEYFGWNSKNIRLVNCKVESLQGFCFIDNLVMENCTLENTTLAFEYSTVDIDANSRIDSVKNPLSGVIRASEIGELILEEDKVDVSKTAIIKKD
ncbi:MAG: DUF3737 family protein [Clostridia bacterium]|nr:DUF3737 family protein [Clostridia bacterium]